MKKREILTEIRLDKYLSLSMLYKHRSDAVDDINGGKIRLNGAKVKPSKMIKVGDIILIKKDGIYTEHTIKDINSRGVKKSDAAEVYFKKQVVINPKNSTKLSKEMQGIKEILDKQDRDNKKEMAHKGKPNKKERRILAKYKRGE